MRLTFAIACLLFAPALAARCLGDYPAPDKSTVVKISSTNRSHESLVIFEDAKGKILHKEDYSSQDMEHGDVVDTCAWTPDSKFFVYSVYSSGGHQAWHFRTEFYSREHNEMHLLDDLVGPVTDPDFTVTTPDIVHTIGWVIDKSQVHITRKVTFDPSKDAPNFEYGVSLSKLLIHAPTSKSK